MQKPYLFHKLLPEQVKEYMEENKHVNMEVMINHLIQNYYRQYGDKLETKKGKEFRRSVNKAYDWVLSQRKSNSVGKKEKIADDCYTLDYEGCSPDIIIENETKRKSSYESSFLDNMYKASSPACNGSAQKPTPKKTETPKNLKRKRKLSNEFKDSQLPPQKSKKSNLKKLSPTCTLSADYVGLDNIIEEMSLLCAYIRGDEDRDIPKSVLIVGPKGSGKSMIVECLAGELSIPLFRISAKSLLGGVGVDPESLITEIVTEARSGSPCIIHLDDVDDLSPKEHGSSKKSDVKIADCLKKIIEEQTNSINTPFLVIVEARDLPDPDVCSELELEITLPMLSNESKILLLKKFLNPKRPVSSDVDFDEVAERCTSFVAGDLKILVKRAASIAILREMKEGAQGNLLLRSKYLENITQTNRELKREDLLSALPKVTPTLKQEGFQRPSKVKWEDVQGLDHAKKLIKHRVIGPIINKEKYKRHGINNPSGILMYGPPGCGKTMLAQAIANQAGISLQSVKGPELLQMYQGESERAVRDVFKRAASVAPSIIFFDEFDALCPTRSGNADNGSRTSIVNTLLAETNGIDEQKDVYVIAATNRPDIVDNAILRPGRIGTFLYVGVPNQKGREDILQSSAKNVNIAPDVDFSEIASWCENFSGADCAEIFKSAAFEALDEAETVCSDITLKEEGEEDMIFRRHFIKAFENARPSVSVEDLKKFHSMRERYEVTRGKKHSILEIG